ncbi:hypothetical protein ACH4MM_27575 [Streptomyces pratensis]|uniref:hypothetical protein n=1 Tax=Streptomyces pratensis TaxID=1169025 RepID=UPI0037A519B0
MASCSRRPTWPVPDVDDPGRRAVIRPVLTVTASQHQDVLEDFRDSVSSVRPDTGAARRRPA